MSQPSPATQVELTLRPRRVLLSVFLACVLAEAAFFLLDWHVNYGRLIDASPIRNLFNTTREDGMASWFGITQTAFVAFTLWVIFLTERARDQARWVANSLDVFICRPLLGSLYLAHSRLPTPAGMSRFGIMTQACSRRD